MNNLKKLRKEAGISQASLASALDVSQGAIAHYEKGIRKLNVESAKKIIEALNANGVNCTFEDVFPSKKANKA
ncbi:helix-turn-helix transcriptional regulator [Klebsiella aerogenes]|uniref:helix-turn-helix transcriptional regulator n=1 Tax=Klebsiella aerogenes TaxID=548 RepID=UPI000DA1B080|nr:helix-turn-helix transcriptional regulator [Klebsiella aerogenes]HDK5660215.1 helix-turn-helix transcriptional regulator [Klebsiella pneumoniae]WBM99003.1 helix-turn-helix transcriptional regulator [Klebsiella aerogenes]HBV9449153.1 helix-turn-helix transcriptional regulator [Klebsiella aerogenes]HCA3514323.1 helix-turn-helix transcriptional regulator [Klebsiella aerogenes]HCB2856832.1 helix-turn-helix transcriptional regulator [Klebsiella aerogenes]